MFSKAMCRSLMVLMIALFVLPGVTQAGTFDPAGGRTVPLIHGFQDQVQSWADLFWGSISMLWEKEGASIDPNGTPAPGGSGSGSGSGGTGDQTGTTTPGDGGASIDPSGQP